MKEGKDRRPIDSESQLLWDELRRAEAATGKKDCCEAIEKLKAYGWSCLDIYTSFISKRRVKISYCPECGRRLE